MVRIVMLVVVFPLTVSARVPGCPDGYREMRDASQDACNARSHPYGGDRSTETCCCVEHCCWDNCPNADRKAEAQYCIEGISGAMWHPSRTTRKWSDGAPSEESFILCVPMPTTTHPPTTTEPTTHPPTTTEPDKDTTTAMPCNGADSGCKNIQQGDGDCDADSDCQSGLKCGTNNCVGGQFDSTDDCCFYLPTTTRQTTSTTTAILCNGADSGCKNIQQGDGDCDVDSDCQSGLKCGANNCVGDQFDSTDDCCYNPPNMQQGEGDCDADSDCQSGLKCGANNCVGGQFDSTDDCCYQPTTTTQTTSTTTTHPPTTTAALCNGRDSGCTHILQGDGDCDADSDCQSGLKCGANNCVGDQFDSTDDCCYKPLPCNGADSGCKNIQQGDGDCDADSDCQSGLKCGTNNCVGGQFDSTDDCCYRPPTHPTLSLPELYGNRWMAFVVVACAAAMIAASGIAIARRHKDNTAYVSLLEEDGLFKVGGRQ